MLKPLSCLAAILCLAVAFSAGCNPFDDTAQKRELLQSFIGEWSTQTSIVSAIGPSYVAFESTNIDAAEDGSISFSLNIQYGVNRISTGIDYINIDLFTDCKITLEYSPEKKSYFFTAASDDWLKVDKLPLAYSEQEGFAGEAQGGFGDIPALIKVTIKAGESGGYEWLINGHDSEGQELIRCTYSFFEKDSTE